ncbi:glyceraldehyde dehydrogenase subunit beta [Sulfuracidifex tepidarius]|uniref:Glyceraldehyde dehydrogenase medium chain n=1 Tax=Sulfuracidifex tepidarius TaxID=1294262 RepID=A0A510E781_9CREN|nr:glyceraldehyde dehydrogenase subunit beta [Sulfuracidifex tepidarius]BBG25274.1 Glyceraldehyde dehydrogenase medium chain [Sulfuracidifex tepidarius]BBG28068.1 Glyceraldehyde dehydrogenase medium chain [Sulfuracidifex tepidarius]
MYPPKFGYVIPENIHEAMEFLESHDDSRPLAGGHSLIPMLKLRIIRPSYLVELKTLKDLQGIKKGSEYRIGALTTHYEISKSGIPLLSQTASVIADPQVRNMGTIGGSISNADPLSDYPAPLIATNAKVVVISKRGERSVPFDQFQKDMFTTDLSQGELVKEVVVPAMDGYRTDYEKLERKAGDYAIVGVAVAIKEEEGVVKDVRIGLTAVNNKAMRAKSSEEILMNNALSDDLISKAASAAVEYANPSSDIRGSAEYKKKMVKVMTERALKKVRK